MASWDYIGFSSPKNCTNSEDLFTPEDPNMTMYAVRDLSSNGDFCQFTTNKMDNNSKDKHGNSLRHPKISPISGYVLIISIDS